MRWYMQFHIRVVMAHNQCKQWTLDPSANSLTQVACRLKRHCCEASGCEKPTSIRAY
jgi:hypothetical protein